jgi:TPP-dependent pyruvate/acetoin dehydrogenase alpha subunit
MNRSPEELLESYRRMRLIRRFEESLVALVNQGKLAGFLHLYAGQEAIAVGVCDHLDTIDIVNSTHRGHGHCIAKGVDVFGMMAELFGRSTGICGGKGGSMHIADLDKGMLGANGIVGAGIPLTTGAALTAKTRKTGGVAVGFFGDGATNQGAFHEALNLASVWNLPAVFICENNGYGEATPTEYATALTNLAERAGSYAMPSDTADGMDYFDVHQKAGAAIQRARRGGGPTLLECKTYRYMGHYVGDNLAYRTREESDDWKTNRDPLRNFEQRVLSDSVLATEALRAVDAEVEKLLEDAIAAAQKAPYPSAEDVLTDVYVNAR